MIELKKQLEEASLPRLPKKMDYKIGIIGAGFIVRNCHLVAYRSVGFNPVALCDINLELAKEVGKIHSVESIYSDWKAMIDNADIEILDIALPPHLQLEVLEYAAKNKKILGVLCQKPVAMSLKNAKKMAEISNEAKLTVAVNSNMRYDQSIRALKYTLDNNIIGEPVIASIDMRAIPDWQGFLKDYNMLELYAMGVHHIDAFRYLFGNPEKITTICRRDPRTKFQHTDGITQYTFHYSNGLIATSIDDVWAWPEEPCAKDNYIRWRVEGLKGIAKGDIGWHKREPEPAISSMEVASKDYPNEWIKPKWNTKWFPDAFVGTMANLLCAIEDCKEPEVSLVDNIMTLACIDACYKSIKEERTVYLNEII
ncbi:MAG: Gfo/Idh/MocA family protein [Lachnospirales bacterium]